MPAKKPRKTPGVYVTELDAYPPSVVGVPTAVPVFIGYTEKAEVMGEAAYLKPQKIGSLAEYETIFGTAFDPSYDINEVTTAGVEAGSADFDVMLVDRNGTKHFYLLTQTGSSRFNLYRSMRLFYDNGGGVCYVVAVGDYTDQGQSAGGVDVELSKLREGLDAAGELTGPTMIVIPDAVLLPPTSQEEPWKSADFGTLATAMLAQSGELQDRVAILDVYGTRLLDQNADGFDTQYDNTVEAFRAAVGTRNLNYGAAYFPFLNTSSVQPGEVNYTNVNASSPVPLGGDGGVLTIQAQALYEQGSPELKEVADYISDMATATGSAAITTLNQNLRNALPVLGEIENIITQQQGVLPPSGAMAGVYSSTDLTRGVWNAPANIALASVLSPTINISNMMQEDLNVPMDGKAINALRAFTGRGTVVWGARTLDGNSNDWRYIQVRRTLIYIEQSIKTALDPFVFAANDGNTWSKVISMVSSFLQGLWNQGGLMGATASEAFTVECGLGSTMTGQDILDGYMIVQVTLQIIRPAEFIELTFKQKMEGA